MKHLMFALLGAAGILLSPALSRSQGATAVPFLLVPPSPEGLGIGGGTAAIPTTDAIAPLVNPGQLGLFSLTNLFNASTYIPTSDWLPQYGLSGMSYGVTALNAGYNVRPLLSLPFDLSVGLGYSRVSLDLGTISFTTSAGPAVIGQFQSKESSESYSVGIGLDYCVRLGFGFNFKRVVSEIGEIGTQPETGVSTGKSSATDFGLLLVVPIDRIVVGVSGTSLEIAPRIKPFLDVSLGLVEANVGEAMSYGNGALADPLPRTSAIGLSAGIGLVMRLRETEWQLASVRLVHQAEDLLVSRHGDGTFDYKSGLGDIQFWDDVVLGKSNVLVTSRRGWQVQVGEFFSWRAGSAETPGDIRYTTYGYSICLGGILKFIDWVNHYPDTDRSWIGFLMAHIDLQFHYATYDQSTSGAGSPTAQSLNLVVKGFSF